MTSKQKQWRKNNPVFLVPTQLPKPTLCRPGSASKISVLRERVKNHQLLHHPDDAKGDENIDWDEPIRKTRGGIQ